MPRPRCLRRAVMAVMVTAAVAACPAAGAGAAPGGRPPVRRVLVLSLPGTTWAAVTGAHVPNLDGLFGQAAVGSTSVRAIEKETRPGDGYATIGAGTAAAGARSVEGLAFDTGETFDPGSEVEAYRRRSPLTAADGGVVSIAVPELARSAGRQHRGAEIGALGEALARAGVTPGVVGNADAATRGDGLTTYHREVALALADRQGRVPTGEVGGGLLEDRASAFGRLLDADRALAAFRRVWDVPGRAVVVFEASDLARINAAVRDSIAPADTDMLRRTLEAADALVGRLLSDVDATRDAVIVTGPSDPGDGVHLTVAALRAPGVRPGLLDSATTRRPGYVTLPDLAPTVLQLLGVPRPDSMEGRPYVIHPRSWSGPPVAGFVRADRDARFRDRMVGPVAGGYVGIGIVLLLISAVVLGRGWDRGVLGRALDFLALWYLAIVPLTFFGPLLGVHTVGPYLVLVVGGGVVVGAAAALLRASMPPLAALLALLVGLHVIDVMTGAHLQINTVFGYSPTVGGRFAGFGNLTFGQVAAAAVLLAGIVAHLLPGRRGIALGTGILAVALLADGLPFWGSDVGGVLAAVPAFSLVVLRLSGRTVSWRRLAGLATGAVAAVGGLGLLDLSRPAGQRTHLGRLFEQIGHEGLRPLTDAVQRKLAENLAVLPTSIWIPLVPAVLGFLAWLAYGSAPRLRKIGARVPEIRPALVGLLVAAVLGFALNDSGIAVPAMMLGVLAPVVVRLAVGVARADAGASTPGAAGEAPGPEPQRRAVDDPGAELRVGEAGLA